MLCPGGQLQLNFKCDSEVRLELKDPGYGGPIEGFTLDDCTPLTGDHQAATVQWKGKLEELKGRYVKIKVSGDNVKVFSSTFVG